MSTAPDSLHASATSTEALDSLPTASEQREVSHSTDDSRRGADALVLALSLLYLFVGGVSAVVGSIILMQRQTLTLLVPSLSQLVGNLLNQIEALASPLTFSLGLSFILGGGLLLVGGAWVLRLRARKTGLGDLSAQS